jgi:hypothetical protein
MSARMPNFLIIGAQKSGTTALYAFLRQHPQIFMAAEKEPAYFAFMGRNLAFEGPQRPRSRFFRPPLTLEEYTALFAGVTTEQAVGEASTYYSFCWTEQTARNIQRCIPDVRLIAILRQPADRAYSAFNMMRQRSLEPLDNFQRALDAENGPERANWTPDFRYFENGLYFRKLKPYFDLFPHDQIRIYLYDEWNAQPERVVAGICRFLDINDNATIDFSRRYNETNIPRSHQLQRALNEPNLLKTMATWLFPLRLRRKWKHALGKMNQTRPPRLNPTLRLSLTERYREDILALQDLLQRDLQHWLKSGKA